jgi:AcrR family transcriptional regulator
MTSEIMKKELKKEEILRAAAKVFSSKGYHAARIQDVADVLGMQKGSLYYYIKTKEDLLSGLVEDTLEKSVELTSNIYDTGHTPTEKLRLCIESHLKLFHENKDAFGVFMNEDLGLINKTSGRDIYQLMKEYEKGWEQIFIEGIKKKEFKLDLEYKLVVKSIIGMMNWSYRWYHPEMGHSISDIAKIMTDLVVSGVTKK